MGWGDRIHSAAGKLHGSGKAASGGAIGNNRLRGEDKGRHFRAELKQAGEKIRGAFRKH